jgi:DHA1 family bicyclomycin/chloramphenicol resistance-like MFS transporter
MWHAGGEFVVVPSLSRPRMSVQPRLPPFALVIAFSVLGPFSLHVVIPAIPMLVAELDTGYGEAQRTLTVYLVGIAGGQLVHGPLSDRFGRRPVLLAGMALYALASLGCALSSSIEVLTLLRLLQGATGCVGYVLGRAIIRDCHPRDRAASLIGYTTMAMSSLAAFSPLIAAIVQDAAGWRANFVALGTAGAVVTACIWRWLNETKLDRLEGQGAVRLLANYLLLLRSRAFLAYALCTSFAMAAWYGFVAGAPYVLVRLLGHPPIDYGKYVLIVLAGYVAGNFLAGRLSVRLGGARMIALGQGFALAGAAAQAALLVAGVLTPLALFVPMMVIVFASGLFLPNANAGALSVHPELAGSAAGLTGFLQMLFSALATIYLAEFLADSEAPLIVLTVGCSIASAASLLPLRRTPPR